MPANTKRIDRRTRIGLLTAVFSYVAAYYVDETGQYWHLESYVVAASYLSPIGQLVGLGIIAHGYKDHQLIKDLVTGFILGCIIDEIRYNPNDESALWPTLLLSAGFAALGFVVRNFRYQVERRIAQMSVAVAIKMLLIWLWKLLVSAVT